jgi:ankyrin repeat protein
MSSSKLLVFALLALLLAACGKPSPPTVNLYRAVQVGDLDQIKRHIYWGTDLNQPDPNGDMPLHVAARGGQVGISRELAEHGAALAAPNAAGQTPLDLALTNGKTQVAALLAEAGAPLEPQASLVALVRAGISDRDSFDFLFRRGADVNRPDGVGQAPLHLAVSLGRLETVRRLLLRGADVNQPNDSGATPLALARALDPKAPDTADIIATLRQYGAKLPAERAPDTSSNPQPHPTQEPL